LSCIYRLLWVIKRTNRQRQKVGTVGQNGSGLWQYIYFLSWRLAGLGLKIDLVSITVETSLAALAAVRGKAIVSGIWQLKIVWNCYLCCGASCLSKWHRLYLDFLSAHHESESRTEIQIQIQIHLQIVFVLL